MKTLKTLSTLAVLFAMALLFAPAQAEAQVGLDWDDVRPGECATHSEVEFTAYGDWTISSGGVVIKAWGCESTRGHQYVLFRMESFIPLTGMSADLIFPERTVHAYAFIWLVDETINRGYCSGCTRLASIRNALIDGGSATVTGGPGGGGTGDVTFDLSAPDGINVTEGESVRVLLTATPAVTRQTEVQLHYVPASTTADSTDWTVGPNPITIRAGQTTGTARVNALVDNKQEPIETATLQGWSGTGPITNELTFRIFDAETDEDITFTLTAPDGQNVTEGQSVRVAVTADRAVTSQTVVFLTYLPARSTADDSTSEYTLRPSTRITIEEGETAGTATLTAVQDNVTEGSETLTLQGVIDGETTNALTFTILDDGGNDTVEPASVAVVEGVLEAALSNLIVGETRTLDLTTLFTFDATMFDVTYAVEVAGAAVTASVSGSTLTITTVAEGNATVTVTATSSPRGSSAVTTSQPNANTATVTFDVAVGMAVPALPIAGSVLLAIALAALARRRILRS